MISITISLTEDERKALVMCYGDDFNAKLTGNLRSTILEAITLYKQSNRESGKSLLDSVPEKDLPEVVAFMESKIAAAKPVEKPIEG